MRHVTGSCLAVLVSLGVLHGCGGGAAGDPLVRTPPTESDTGSLTRLPGGAADMFNTLDIVVQDATMEHEATPKGVSSTWEAIRGPKVGLGNTPPAGLKFMIPWGMVYESEVGNASTNTRVELRKIQLYVLSKSTGKWKKLSASIKPGGEERKAGVSAASSDVRVEPSGTISVRTGKDGYHFDFWSGQGRVEIDPADIAGVFSTFQARLILHDPAKPDDRGTAQYIAAAGADYGSSASGQETPGAGNDVGTGRFKYVVNDWRPFNMVTLTEPEIRQNPPPLTDRTIPAAPPVTSGTGSSDAPADVPGTGSGGEGGATTDPSATAAASLKANALGELAGIGVIVISGQSNVTITGRRISNPNGPCIQVKDGSSNVVISGNEIGPCGGHGVEVLGSSEVSVTRNNFRSIGETATVAVDSSGVRARSNFVDGAASGFRGVRSRQIEFEFNGAINVRGPYPYGTFVQLDNVTGAGNRVQCNTANLAIGAPDPSTATATQYIRTEDMMNTWQSSGDPQDPILIAYNRLLGGSSFTGSGIMSGDGGGAYITVLGNRIVNPWNAGIGVAGGSNIRVEGNKVFSEMPGTVAGEGFYIRNFYPSACTNIVHRNNQIKWPATSFSGGLGWVQTFWQPAGECSNVTGTETNNLDAPLSKAIFTEPIPECRARAAQLGLSSSGY